MKEIKYKHDMEAQSVQYQTTKMEEMLEKQEEEHLELKA